MPTRVGIIGCGPSGIFSLAALRPLAQKGEVEMVAFEKQATFGGLWNFSDDTGRDRWGDTVHGSMYRNLWINGPKEALEIPDFLFPEKMPTYTTREPMYAWLERYVEKNQLGTYMVLNTKVEKVVFSNDVFTVKFRKYGAEEPETKDFDYLIVGSGHFSEPHDPDFKGLETFPGRVLHAHNFRNGAEFRGQRVLAIGGSYSAEDIGLQCWKYGASHVTITNRTQMNFKWPESMF